MLRLRPYFPNRDFDTIKNWITDERTHAMWCANLFAYPMEWENFTAVLANFNERFGDSPFAATDQSGKVLGFFSYSLNLEKNEGKLKFVMVDPEYRGKGLGKEMLRLASNYAFEITKADTLSLSVFPENVRAKKCYEAVGFQVQSTEEQAFRFREEYWGRCNMVLKKEDFCL